MKKKYAALMMAAAIMAVPGTLAMAASPNTNVTVSHGGSSSGSASSKSAGLNVNAGTITNKTSTGIKNSGQNGSNGITAGVPLYRVTGDPALVGYSPLMPAQQLMTTDANGVAVSEPVTVNIAVAALGDVQNVEIYYYSETDHKWELAPVNGIDHATNSVNVTIPGNAVFTLVHKN